MQSILLITRPLNSHLILLTSGMKVNVGSSKDDRTVILDLDHYRNMLVRRGENFKKVFADVRSVWRGRILSLRNITISAIGK